MVKRLQRVKAVHRIKRMEKCFDFLLRTFENDGKKALDNKTFCKKLDRITHYYQNGLWLSDYERDERGELPQNLKRGCLSQDGIYDLLSDIYAHTDDETEN